MPTTRPLIPDLLAGDEYVRLNGRISLSDKRTVLSACADDGIFTLITAYAFKHTAEFIRAHDIVSYDPAKYALLTDFICNRTDPRTARPATVVDDAGAAKGLQHKSSPAPSKPSSVGKSSPRRTGLKTGEVKGSND